MLRNEEGNEIKGAILGRLLKAFLMNCIVNNCDSMQDSRNKSI